MLHRFLETIKEKQSYQLLLLLGLVAFTAALRLYRIGRWSFWGDEWITVRRTTELSSFNLLDLPALSLLLTRLSLDALGTNEVAARLPAALIGVLTIPILYFVARRMVGPLSALLACLLLAVSQWHLYWSQNARFYTSLLLFFTLALIFFYYGLERDRPLYLILSLVFLALAIKERDVAAFLGPITFIYVLLLVILRFPRPSGLNRRNLLLFFGPGILAAVWLLYHNFIIGIDNWERAFGFVNNNPVWILAGVVFYVGLPLACFAAAGAAILLRKRNRAGLLLTLTAVLPLLAIMALALIQYTANRYVFISLTSIAILGGVAARELLQQMPKPYTVVALSALAVVVLAPMSDNLLYYRYQNGNRDNWKAAFAFIQERAGEDDRIVTPQQDLADYYLQRETSNLHWGDVDDMLGDEERVWFVLDLTTPSKEPVKHRWVVNNAQHVAAFDVTVAGRTFPMRVYLYESQATRQEVQETQTTAGSE